MAAWGLELPFWETLTPRKEPKANTKTLIFVDTYESGKRIK
jgi:hypothetical protein